MFPRGALVATSALFALLPLAVGACSQTERRHETAYTGGALGTTYSVKVITEGAMEPGRTQALEQSILTELETVNRLMSTYLADSEVSRFNAHASRDPVPLSDPTLAVVEESLEVWRSTSGAFDVTVGPLVDLWGFGPTRPRDSFPSDAEIESLRAHTGSAMLHLDRAAGTLAKDQPSLHLDLSAIAKGYAVDRVAEALHQGGFGDFLVEVGGEIVTRGHNLEDRPWRLAIERPVAGAARQLYKTIEASDIALATSGDYRNRRWLEGRSVSHTIDPRTGRPIAHDLASVSVLAERCSTADAWATALNVLGPDEGHEIALEHQIAALFLVYDGNDRVREVVTPAFRARLAASPADTISLREAQP